MLAIGLLPGALLRLVLRGDVGWWGVGLSDCVLRFVGAAALLDAVAAPLTYRLWTGRAASAGVTRSRLPCGASPSPT